MNPDKDVVDVTGAEIYSQGWVAEDNRVYAIWYELPNGSLALSTYVLGAQLGQDQKPHILAGPGP